MGGTFYDGERKDRPGAYFTYKNIGLPRLAGAVNGIGAITIAADWGPLNKVVELETDGEIKALYGTGGHVDNALEVIYGGARSVLIARLGSGGGKSAYTLKDAKGEDALTVEMLYPGERAFQITLRDMLGDGSKKELLVLEGTTQRQAISFSKEGNQCRNFMEALAKEGSRWITAYNKCGDGEPLVLENVTQVPMTGGVNPEIKVADYSDAFTLLEPMDWNAVTVDTADTSVHRLLQTWIDRIFEDGKLGIAVVGEPVSVDFETRLAHAAVYNDFRMVYFGNGWVESGGEAYDGPLAFARITGMVAAIPSNGSLTHKQISGALEPMEELTNVQHKQAIQHGMMTLSRNKAKTIVWIEYGINTLTYPQGQEDIGWQKIRRVKERYELINRIIETTEPLIGNLDNDDDGRATIIQIAKGVAREMVAERKLLPDYDIGLDPAKPPEGDSAWFYVQADDIDSLEKQYFTFRFRYSSNG